MASIVIGAAAAALVPSSAPPLLATLAGAFGAGVGAVIDQQLIFPKLFDQSQRVQAPQFQDVQLQTGSEGAPIKVCYGPKNRLAGTAIYISGLDPIPTGTSRNPGWESEVDLAIAICEGPINQVKKIWAEDKLIFQEGGITIELDIQPFDPWHDRVFDGGVIGTCDPRGGFDSQTGTLGNTPLVGGDSSGWCVVDNYYLFGTIEIEQDGPNLGQFQAGTITTSGHPIDWWNREWTTFNGGFNRTNGNTFINLRSNIAAHVAAPGKSIQDGIDAGVLTLQQFEIFSGDVEDENIVIDSYAVQPMSDTVDGNTINFLQVLDEFSVNTAEDFNIYVGTNYQTEDTTIANELGVNLTPGYQNICYLVIKNFALNKWGNRVPQFTFEVEAQAEIKVSAVVQDVLERAGIETADIDVSGVDDANLEGYIIGEPKNPLEILEPIFTSFDLIALERDGQIVIKQRANATEWQIAREDMAAATKGSDPDYRPIKSSDTATADLPAEVNVRFINTDNDYRRGVAKYRLNDPIEVPVSNQPTFSSNRRLANRQLDIVMTHAFAKAIAKRLLVRSQVSRQKSGATLPPNYMEMEEGDVAVFNAGTDKDGNDDLVLGQSQIKMLVSEMNRGANALLEYDGEVFDSTSATQTGEADEGTTAPDIFSAPGVVNFDVIDSGAFNEDNHQTPGVYVAASLTTATDVFNYFDLYYTTDDEDTGEGFEFVASIQNEAVVGQCLTVLGDVEFTSFMDNGNALDVFVPRGTLTSVSKADLMADNTLNLINVGREVLQFQTAELIDERVYRLSGFIRGLRDTAPWAAAHGPGEIMSLYDAKRWQFVPLPAGLRFGYTAFRCVPRGVSPTANGIQDKVLSNTFFFNTRPLAPQMLRHEFQDNTGNDQMRLSWLHRSRLFDAPFATKPGRNVEKEYIYTDVPGSQAPIFARCRYVISVSTATFNSLPDFPPLAGLRTQSDALNNTPSILEEYYDIENNSPTSFSGLQYVSIAAANESYGWGNFHRQVIPRLL